MRTKNPIEFCKIDVESISQPYIETQTPEQVNRMADSIIETGELIIPLLVRQTGLITYEVLNEWNNILNFCASKEAKKRDPRKFEMVNAFVVTDNKIEDVVNQITLFFLD